MIRTGEGATKAFFFLACACVGLTGCYTRAPALLPEEYENRLNDVPNSESSIGCEGQRIGDALVLIGPDIQGRREEVFNDHSGPEYIRRGVIAGLMERSLADAESPKKLVIGIDQFRLKSTLFNGSIGPIAGPDRIAVTVFASCAGIYEPGFQTSVNSMKLGIYMASSQGRFNGMVRVLSERIARGYAARSDPGRYR